MENNKVAVITGSARGIGLATALALGQNGYTIVVSDVTEKEGAGAALSELEAAGVRAYYKKCDISHRQDREELIEDVVKQFGRLDVLVNNAGVAPTVRTDILETTEESFDRLLNINLKGTFFMCQLAANAMVRLQESGIPDYQPRIINIGSISAYTSSTMRGEYCISKAGVSMVTKLFADRLAEKNIPVFEVRPGIILTDMTSSVKEKYDKLIEEGITPTKRFGYPKDVANCVLAACSGLLDFSTGQILNADGGFHIRRL